MLDLDRDELGSETLEHLQGLAHRALDGGLDPLEEEPLRYAEPLPCHVGGQGGDTRSPASTSKDRRQSPTVRAIGPTWSHDQAQGTMPAAADAAVGRLEAGHAVERGRVADRRAGVAAQAEGALAGGHRGRRAAARAARDAGRVPGVAGGRGLGAEGELVGHRLSEDHRAGGSERGHHRRVAGGDPPPTGRRAGLGRQAGDVHQVLHSDRDPAQEPALAAAPGRRRPRGRRRARPPGRWSRTPAATAPPRRCGRAAPRSARPTRARRASSSPLACSSVSSCRLVIARARARPGVPASARRPAGAPGRPRARSASAGTAGRRPRRPCPRARRRRRACSRQASRLGRLTRPRRWPRWRPCRRSRRAPRG